ncbi:MAG: hypothetical protein IPM42_08630 [Saprospiraceae bacterium]|nr:hypothetical protein [Saprospiraceae bacterium]
MQVGKILMLSFIASFIIWVLKLGKIPMNINDIFGIVVILTGWTFFLFTIPLIITYFIKWIGILLNKPIADKSLNIILFVICIIYTLSFADSISSNHSHKETSPTINSDIIVYKPKNSEYKLNFNKSPTISKISTKILDEYFDGEMALVKDTIELCIIKSEYYKIGTEIVDFQNEENIVQMLKDYSAYQGYKAITINYAENELGKIGSVRGYKIINDRLNNEIKTVYESYHYFKDDHYLSLYAASPSDKYPTVSITEFFRSVSAK